MSDGGLAGAGLHEFGNEKPAGMVVPVLQHCEVLQRLTYVSQWQRPQDPTGLWRGSR